MQNEAEQLTKNMTQVEKDLKQAAGQELATSERLHSQIATTLQEERDRPSTVQTKQILELMQIQSSRIEELVRLQNLQSTTIAKLAGELQATILAISPDMDRLERLLRLAARLAATLDAYRQQELELVRAEIHS